LRCTGKSSDLGPRISKWAKVLTNKHLHWCQPLGTPHFHILISVPETRYSPVASTIHLSPCRCSIIQKIIVGEQVGAEEAEGGVGVEVSELVFESFTHWPFNFDANCSSVRTH